MDRPNVGDITPRANVCSCSCNREGICSCDCLQTNEIGIREDDEMIRMIMNRNGNNNNNQG